MKGNGRSSKVKSTTGSLSPIEGQMSFAQYFGECFSQRLKGFNGMLCEYPLRFFQVQAETAEEIWGCSLVKQ